MNFSYPVINGCYVNVTVKLSFILTTPVESFSSSNYCYIFRRTGVQSQDPVWQGITDMGDECELYGHGVPAVTVSELYTGRRQGLQTEV